MEFDDISWKMGGGNQQIQTLCFIKHNKNGVAASRCRHDSMQYVGSSRPGLSNRARMRTRLEAKGIGCGALDSDSGRIRGASSRPQSRQERIRVEAKGIGCGALDSDSERIRGAPSRPQSRHKRTSAGNSWSAEMQDRVDKLQDYQQVLQWEDAIAATGRSAKKKRAVQGKGRDTYGGGFVAKVKGKGKGKSRTKSWQPRR